LAQIDPPEIENEVPDPRWNTEEIFFHAVRIDYNARFRDPRLKSSVAWNARAQ
jgi:hypothetical protein